MTVREYELSLSPKAAITALQQSTALDAAHDPSRPVLTLQKVPPRLRDVAEFRRILIVAALSLLTIAWFSPLVASWVLGIQALCVAVVWLLNRRGIALVNDALVGLVWRAWAPALRSHAPGVYRGLPAD